MELGENAVDRLMIADFERLIVRVMIGNENEMMIGRRMWERMRLLLTECLFALVAMVWRD
jgi:hypothetical protein